MRFVAAYRLVWLALPVLVLLSGVRGNSSARAQTLYSFEASLDGFIPQGGGDSDYINHFQTTTGATDGTMAMGIETGTGFGRDVVVNETTAGDPQYDLFNTVAANPSAYTFDFDVTFTNSSWANVADPGSYFAINVFSNSDAGFTESFGVANGTPGSASSATASMPASQLSLATNSSFFQLGLGTNSNHVNGSGGEGVQYFVDNLRFSKVPQFLEKKLFSWETPNDPGTPDVDESLEGWKDGFSNAPWFHERSVTTTEGVTDGGSALQINSPADPPNSGFTWGSQFNLDSGETGDPANQSQIDALIADINGADRIAFDVTFNSDQFPFAGSYLSLFLNVSDQAGTFYQSPAKQAGNPVTLAGQTIPIEIPLSELTAGAMNLADDGLMDGNFFRFALATNSNDGVKFIIDNFRLLTELTGLDGDYNNDGIVDAADYTAWRDNLGALEGALPNDPDGGMIGSAQYTTWSTNFGNVVSGSVAAVPEPASFATLAIGAFFLIRRGRRIGR